MRGEHLMQNFFKNAKWIWHTETPSPDEYGEFYTTFDYHGGALRLHVSADSNYAVYVNGSLAAFGQYADFPYDKVYDTVDITKYAKIGENHLAIIVWYYGITSTSVYYKGNAALLFSLEEDSKILAQSDEKALCRMSRAYDNHKEKIITGQLGLSFSYNATREDDWMMGHGEGMHQSFIVEQTLPLRPRPCEKLTYEAPRFGTLIKCFTETDVLYDLGTNEVGFLSLDMESEKEQTVIIAYGEHIEDGGVRRLIGNRDFSVEVTLKKGRTIYENPFRRLGCRYLEVFSEASVKVNAIAIVPTMYPITEKERPTLTDGEREIYDICVRTLRLCMHEHYEDCPWREQALYCMDSRNQMLLGYYAFGETRFPRANLELISKDAREDGLLSICYPITKDLVIPSFSLHYFTECAEYLEHSGDVAFLREIYPKLKSIMNTFLSRIGEDGLAYPFGGPEKFNFSKNMNYWNFYEWSEGLDGVNISGSEPDIILSALLSIALDNMAKIAATIGKEDTFSALRAPLNQAIHEAFYSEEKGFYLDRKTEDRASMLGNALAILCGAATGEAAKRICEILTAPSSLTPVTLSMQCFVYDALLLVDRARFADYILADIEKNYRPMVDYGVGTVWETAKGDKDFNHAGSLCHGWSAIPIYYYHILKKGN